MNRLWLLVLRLSTFTPLSMLFFVFLSEPLWEWSHTFSLALGAIIVVNILLIGSLTLLGSWTTRVWSIHHHSSLVSRIAGALYYSALVPLLVSGTSLNIIGSLRNPLFWLSWTCYLGVIFFELDHYLNKWALKLNDELNKRTSSLLAGFKAYSEGLGVNLWNWRSYAFILTAILCLAIISLRGSTYLTALWNPPSLWETDLNNNWLIDHGIFDEMPFGILVLPFDYVLAINDISTHYWYSYTGVSLIGLIMPLALSISFVMSSQSLIWDNKRTILLSSLAAFILEMIAFGISSPLLPFNYLLVPPLILVQIPTVLLFNKEGAETAAITNATLAVPLACLADALCNPPQGSFGNWTVYGFTGFPWIVAIVYLVTPSLVSLYLSTNKNDNEMFSSIVRVDKAIARLWLWGKDRSRRFKTIMVIALLTGLFVLSQSPGLPFLGSFDKVQSDWDDGDVRSIASIYPLIFVATSEMVYVIAYNDASYPLYRNLTHDGQSFSVSDMAIDFGMQSGIWGMIPDNLSMYFTTHSTFGPLVCANAEGIRDLSNGTQIENSTLSRIALDSDERMLYTGGMQTGLWSYNLTSGNMLQIADSYNLENNQITALDVIDRYIFVGTRSGFYVYDWAESIWLPKDNRFSSAVFDFEVSPDSKTLYVASLEGLLVYSLQETNITYVDVVNPFHGLASAYTICVRYDINIGQLVVGTVEGLCMVDPNSYESEVVLESTGPAIGYAVRTASFYVSGVYYLFIHEANGNLYRLVINYALLNSPLWRGLTSLAENMMVFALTIMASVIAAVFASRYDRKREKS